MGVRSSTTLKPSLPALVSMCSVATESCEGGVAPVDAALVRLAGLTRDDVLSQTHRVRLLASDAPVAVCARARATHFAGSHVYQRALKGYDAAVEAGTVSAEQLRLLSALLLSGDPVSLHAVGPILRLLHPPHALPHCIELSSSLCSLTARAASSLCRAVDVREGLASPAPDGPVVEALTFSNDVPTCVAVSSGEQWLVVCFAGKNHEVVVFALPSGTHVRSIGTSGTSAELAFNDVSSMCFMPSGNLLVVDSRNYRLQEVTLQGVFVRFVGVGQFVPLLTGRPFCVAASATTIAVSTADAPVSGVMMFDVVSGSIGRRFGTPGTASGQLHGHCTSLCFSPDGTRLVLAESESHRISVFTTAGEFIQHVAVGSLSGACGGAAMIPTGEFVVADVVRACLFSPDGSNLLRSWKLDGPVFMYPTALALSGSSVYVLRNSSYAVTVLR